MMDLGRFPSPVLPFTGVINGAARLVLHHYFYWRSHS